MHATIPIRRLTLALVLVAGLPAAAQAQAQRELPRDEPGAYVRPEAAQQAIDELKSPYCPGLMLEVCPSPGGAALRDSINDLAEAGMSGDEIVEWVIANHGEEWRALPKAEGRSLIAWIVPPAAVLAGLLLVVGFLRSRRSTMPRVAPVEGTLSEDEERRLRDAIREIEAEEEVSLF